jgi:hypothetical protein
MEIFAAHLCFSTNLLYNKNREISAAYAKRFL